MGQIIQLDPTLPFSTPKGDGWAHFLIEHGDEHHLQWVVFINEGEHEGQCWTFENTEVRIQDNWTMGRGRK